MHQAKCLVQKWFPGAAVTETSIAEAMFLENRYWENMGNAITNGIRKSL